MEDARLGRRASRRAAESRGCARLGSTGRVSALEGPEDLAPLESNPPPRRALQHFERIRVSTNQEDRRLA